MKTLYLECNMGVAGDMLMAALYELIPDKEDFLARMNALGLEGVSVRAVAAAKCGITGTRMAVTINGGEEESHDVSIKALSHSGEMPAEGHDHNHDHNHDHDHNHNHHDHDHNHDHNHDHRSHGRQEHAHHHHTGLSDIAAQIGALPVSPLVKENALAVYGLIAEAEAHAHGRTVAEVHFHEVGSKDAVADIVGVCLAVEMLAPDEIVASPVHVGSGFVRCAHGVLPVPAPATAHILRGVPSYGGQVRGELCTPTGAALLKYFAARFVPMPVMAVTAIGYGMGKKDFEAANCVRAFWGETAGQEGGPNGQVAELRCNVDDMTGEAVGYVCRLLLEQGARDVFTAPVQMKKDRPGVLITCVCDAGEANRFAALLLQNTSTFGVRKTVCDRYMLGRHLTPRETPYGSIRVKTGTGYGAKKTKAEYEDVAAAAKLHGVPFEKVAASALDVMENSL